MKQLLKGKGRHHLQNGDGANEEMVLWVMPNLETWVWSLESPWWKERSNLDKTSSDLHMHKAACAHPHIYTKRINSIKNKSYGCTTCISLPSTPALTGSSSRVTALPAPSVQLQSQESNLGSESKRLQHSTSQHRSSPNAVNAGARPACSVAEVVDISSNISKGWVYICSPPCSLSDRKLSKKLLVCSQVTSYYLNRNCSTLSQWVPQGYAFCWSDFSVCMYRNELCLVFMGGVVWGGCLFDYFVLVLFS